MYRSLFSYSITKPYPYRWFAPVTFVGGVILAVLFSLVNLAAQGYQLRTIYTNDPNSTLAEQQLWFMKAPFNWGDSLRPSCQPFFLSVGHQFFSTNLGFNYEVTSISRYDGESNQTISLASVPYLNNTLRDCQTNRVLISLERSDRAPPPSWWISWSLSETTSWAQCIVDAEAGPANVTFQTKYRGNGGGDYSFVIKNNYTSHASMWWGTRLINAYWNGIMSAMSFIDQQPDALFTRGNMDFRWNGTNKNIRDLDLFSFSFFFLQEDSLIDNVASDQVRMLNNASLYSSQVLTQGLFWAKIMHSALMVDLGNDDSPNFLLNTDDLKYLLSGEGDMVREPPGISFADAGYESYARIPQPDVEDTLKSRVLITESYQKFGSRLGSLGTRNATMYAQYACSISVRKSTGTMLLGILIANLVFLQAAWKILNLVAESMVSKQQPTANFCDGCLRGTYEIVDMQGLRSPAPANKIGMHLNEGESTQHLVGDSTQHLVDSRP